MRSSGDRRPPEAGAPPERLCRPAQLRPLPGEPGPGAVHPEKAAEVAERVLRPRRLVVAAGKQPGEARAAPPPLARGDLEARVGRDERRRGERALAQDDHPAGLERDGPHRHLGADVHGLVLPALIVQLPALCVRPCKVPNEEHERQTEGPKGRHVHRDSKAHKSHAKVVRQEENDIFLSTICQAEPIAWDTVGTAPPLCAFEKSSPRFWFGFQVVRGELLQVWSTVPSYSLKAVPLKTSWNCLLENSESRYCVCSLERDSRRKRGRPKLVSPSEQHHILVSAKPEV
mmetsp:Transcript_31763/g.75434  ORF Transcript_31763/g.75434 Transcript_31763/m.75434 type:complete len:287 (+) Transcript_31763:489-1349(+)